VGVNQCLEFAAVDSSVRPLIDRIASANWTVPVAQARLIPVSFLGGTRGRRTQFCMTPHALRRAHANTFQLGRAHSAGVGGKWAAKHSGGAVLPRSGGVVAVKFVAGHSGPLGASVCTQGARPAPLAGQWTRYVLVYPSSLEASRHVLGFASRVQVSNFSF
jgi:hypothetical protein